MNTLNNAICVMITSSTLPAKLAGATITTTRPGYTWIRVELGGVTRQQFNAGNEMHRAISGDAALHSAAWIQDGVELPGSFLVSEEFLARLI